jgi:hypothetical protein
MGSFKQMMSLLIFLLANHEREPISWVWYSWTCTCKVLCVLENKCSCPFYFPTCKIGVYHNMWANSTFIKLFVIFFKKLINISKTLELYKYKYIFIFIMFFFSHPIGLVYYFHTHTHTHKKKAILYLVHAHEKVWDIIIMPFSLL